MQRWRVFLILFWSAVWDPAGHLGMFVAERGHVPTLGAITGLVTTVDGVPLAGALVLLRGIGSSKQFTTETDPRGVFRIDTLPPGWFDLSASKPGYSATNFGAADTEQAGTPLVIGAQTVSGLVIQLARTTELEGTVRRNDGLPFGGCVVVALVERISLNGIVGLTSLAEASTDEQGHYRFLALPPNEYVIRVQPPRGVLTPIASSSSSILKGPSLTSYAATYFPSSLLEKDSTRIRLQSGERRAGADVLTRLVSLGSLEGQVIVPVGSDPIGKVDVYDATTSGPAITSVPLRKGRFLISELRPGPYRIIATLPDSGLRSSALAGLPEGEAVKNIMLTAHPAARLSGHVILPDSEVGAAPPVTRLAAYGRLSDDGTTVTAVASVGADGSFMFSDLDAGEYAIRTPASGTPQTTWALVSIKVDKDELIDNSLELHPGEDLHNVLVTFSNQLGEVFGSVTNEIGAGLPHVTLVLFPENREAWKAFRPRVFASMSALTGEYRIKGVPKGRYRIAAVRDPKPNQWLLPTFLESIVDGSIPTQVVGVEPQRLDLRAR